MSLRPCELLPCATHTRYHTDDPCKTTLTDGHHRRPPLPIVRHLHRRPAQYDSGIKPVTTQKPTQSQPRSSQALSFPLSCLRPQLSCLSFQPSDLSSPASAFSPQPSALLPQTSAFSPQPSFQSTNSGSLVSALIAIRPSPLSTLNRRVPIKSARQVRSIR